MDRRIEDLQLSVRSTNALLNAGIKTVAQLLEQSEQNLRAIDNLGEKSVREILVLIGMLKFYNQQNEWSCVLYRGLDNLIYEDIPLKRLGLPLYLEARLKKNKFRTVGDVDKVELSELFKIEALGKTGIERINRMLCASRVNVRVKVPSKKQQLPDLCVRICKELKEHPYINIPRQLLAPYLILDQLVYTIMKEGGYNPSKGKEEELRIIEVIYRNEVLSSMIKVGLKQMVSKGFTGKTIEYLNEHMPLHMQEAGIIKKLIEKMVVSKLLSITPQGKVVPRLMTVMEFVESLNLQKKDRTGLRDKGYLMGKLMGKTLDSLGKEDGLTRERVRQIIDVLLASRPPLAEDRYREVFEAYNFSKKDFMIGFNEPGETYEYLKIAYNHGEKDVRELAKDKRFPLEFRKCGVRMLKQDVIVINKEQIRKKRMELMKYYIRKNCPKAILFDTFSHGYAKFLKSQGLDDNRRYEINDLSFKNSIRDSRYVLWKLRRRFRYYDIDGHDFTKMLRVLNLSQYKNVEYSAQKFFTAYPEVMKEYDIDDEYELHNLLKKLLGERKGVDIHFRRMPIIKFGHADRGQQVFDVLKKIGPCTVNELAQEYEKEYGVSYRVFRASYMRELTHNRSFSSEARNLLIMSKRGKKPRRSYHEDNQENIRDFSF